MTTLIQPRTRFVSGEITPRLWWRTDLDLHIRACREAVNLFVTPHGPVIRRSGTRFMGTPDLNGGQAVRFIPFRPAFGVDYIIEATNQRFRFWALSGLVMNGSNPVQLTTPWTDDQIFDLAFAQDGEDLYLVHPETVPYKLTRLSPTSFSLAPVDFDTGRAPLGPVNQVLGLTVTLSGTWPNITATFSSDPQAPPNPVGRTLYVSDRKNKRSAYLRIDTVNSATQYTCTGLLRYPDNALPAATSRFAFSLFASGFGCSAVAIHQGRLFYGGFTQYPDMFVASVVDAYDVFELENPQLALNDAENASAAFARRLASDRIDRITWIVSSGGRLLVGSTSAEYLVTGGTDNVLTPLEATVQRVTSRGSEPIPPVALDERVVFVQSGGRALRAAEYSLTADGITTPELSVTYEHLLRSGVAELAFVLSPEAALFALTNDGELVGTVLQREQEVLGAFRIRPAGRFQDRPAQIVTVQPLRDPEAGEDRLLAVVARTIAGQDVLTVELFQGRWELTAREMQVNELARNRLDYAWFLDCALSFEDARGFLAVAGNDRLLLDDVTGLSVGNVLIPREVFVVTTGGDVILSPLDRTPLRITAVYPSTNEILVELLDGTPVSLASWGGVLVSSNARVYRRVSSVAGLTHLADEDVVVFGDGSFLGVVTVDETGEIDLPRPASLVVVGLPYETALTITHATGLPGRFDDGRPVLLSRARVVSLGSLGVDVSVGGGLPEPAFPSPPPAVFDRPPAPFVGTVDIPLRSTRDGEPVVRLSAVQPYPMHVAALYLTLGQYEK